MIEAGRRARFDRTRVPYIAVAHRVVIDQLDGDRAVEQFIQAAVNRPIPPRPSGSIS